MRRTQSGRAAHHAVHDNELQTGSGLARFAHERPLLIAAAGIALGMGLGALLPWHRIEDELFGQQARKLKEGALELASEGLEKGKSAARHVVDAATGGGHSGELEANLLDPA